VKHWRVRPYSTVEERRTKGGRDTTNLDPKQNNRRQDHDDGNEEEDEDEGGRRRGRSDEGRRRRRRTATTTTTNDTNQPRPRPRLPRRRRDHFGRHFVSAVKANKTQIQNGQHNDKELILSLKHTHSMHTTGWDNNHNRDKTNTTSTQDRTISHGLRGSRAYTHRYSTLSLCWEKQSQCFDKPLTRRRRQQRRLSSTTATMIS